MEQNHTLSPFSLNGSLLIVWPISALIWVMWSRHLPLGWRTLHSWRWGPSWGRPHPRAESSWLIKRGTERALVFRELLHGVGVVVMRWGGINRGPTVLWWRSRGWVVHIRGHLAHYVPWWWSDWWGSRGHGGRWGLVVHHMWCSRCLGRMLHWVADRRRWGRRGAEVLLRWCHHVMRVGHNRWLTRIVSRMVVWGLTRNWYT